MKTPNHTISERKFFLRLFDVLFIVLGLILVSKYLSFEYFDIKSSNVYLWFFTLIIYFLVFGQISELYNLKVSSSRFLVIRSIIVSTFFTTIFFIFTPIISPVLPENRIQILFLFLTIFISLTLWRFTYIGLVFLPKYYKYVLLIGDSTEVLKLINTINRKAPDNFIVGYLSKKKIKGQDKHEFFDVNKISLSQLADNSFISEIVVASNKFSNSKEIHNDLIYLFENGMHISSVEKYVEKITFRVPEIELNDSFYDYLTISENQQNNFYLVFVRFIDIIIALAGVFMFALVLPFIIIGNLIGNRGSFLYFQERVGVKGKPFKIFKLRTMVKNAEKNGAVWAQRNDMRITKFGKILRKTRLDETPQVFNILKGDMSFIGPRPERPEFVTQLEKEIPFYALRHVIKPGLTGWAQVKYPYANSIEEQKIKLRYDLYYIKERSVLLDFRIFMKTFGTVVLFKGQ